MLTAAVTRLAAEEGHVTESIKERYRRIARGGPGSMVVEAAVVLPSRSSFNLRISDDQFVSELKELVDETRGVNADVKIGLQIMHFLKLSRSGWRQKVEDLKPEEVKAIPELFASAASRTRKAGFDFVEIHMAHFTTLASFLSLVNKREDEYGGDLEARTKLPTEVVLAVRDAVGDAYPVGVRINGEEFTKEGNTLLQSTRIARRLAGCDIDYISVSAGERFEDAEPPSEGFPPFPGTGYSGARMSPRWWSPDGVQVYLAEGIRGAIREAGYNIPVVTAGKIRTPELAEEILEQERADIIGMARALFSDPDWPMKAKEGKADDIVICAACGYCSESDERYEKVTCINWPKGTLNPPSPWLLSPPCSAACPAGINIRGYIDLISRGKLRDALELIKEKCPFPGVVSRVCPAFCEKKCNRTELDDSIAINPLKRFVVDRVGLDKEEITAPVRKKTERVAVVGSGPAGLSAGFYLVKMGYGVAVFEALPVAGGMMSVGIQQSRLPRDLVKMEIENIRKTGVEIKVNARVGKNGLTLDDLWQQGYQAIFLAVGTPRKRKLRIPGDKEGSFPIEGIPDFSFLNKDKFTVTPKNRIKANPHNLTTGVKGIFAGGDMVNGPTSVIQAIASGRKAAMVIDKYLCGEEIDYKEPAPDTISIEDIDTDMFKERRRQEMPKKGGFTEEAGLYEADRCLKCGLFPKK
jgi:2,4-dienoyl-CoA reductase-like NADH-dependent reductase (Old Yellow Enzyme family)